jgi:hypothetical protein
LERDELVSKIQSFTFALRRKKWNQLLAGLALLLFSSGVYLNEAWKQFLIATYIAYAAYACSAVCFVWLLFRIWKEATPPPKPPERFVPSAIKGLLPFTFKDGTLFARLGRDIELQILVNVAQDPQTPICAVRGQSGAGKTSLLQAGLVSNLGETQCVYWEAVPNNAATTLLHAIATRFPEVQDLDSLPTNCSSRFVLILDQFEQLSRKEKDQVPIFELLSRIAKSPAPRNLTAVVAFRREFSADWLDFEQARGFRAEQIPISLLAKTTAEDAFITLASEAGLTVDNALVSNFISSVQTSEGVSPADLAIGILSLANFAQRTGEQRIGNTEYRLAGGAEGLLRSYVEQKLEEEVPEAMRRPLLKGIVLALIDLSKEQRVAEGATLSIIASRAEIPESTLSPSLERLAHPRVRLLEKLDSNHYRLPHERLVPVLRQLTGTVLASLDRLKLVFEDGFARWSKTRSRQYLLTGEDLSQVSRNRSHFLKGEGVAQRTKYLAACLAGRDIRRGITSGLVLTAMIIGFLTVKLWNDSIDSEKLKSWDIQPELIKEQELVDSINLSRRQVNDLSWLHHDVRLKEIMLSFSGASLKGIEKLTGLTSLTLNLNSEPAAANLVGLEKLTGLTSLTVNVNGIIVPNLPGLEKLTGLTSLTLDLRGSEVQDLSGLGKLTRLTSLTLSGNVSDSMKLSELDQLRRLTSLTLDLNGSRRQNLEGLEKLTGLTSLTLDLSHSWVENLDGLEKLTKLASLTLNLGGSHIRSLDGLEKLTGLTSLTLDLRGSLLRNLDGLEKLTGLTSLKLFDSDVTGLDQLRRLTSLTFDLNGSEVDSLAGLEKLTGLTSLILELAGSDVRNLDELEMLTGLTSLTLNLSDSQVKTLAPLEKLRGLTSLTLDLSHSRVATLAPLEKLTGLTSLTLVLVASDAPNLADLAKATGLTSLAIDLNGSRTPNLAGLEKLTGLTSLTLNLVGSDVQNLDELDKLARLKTLDLAVSSPTILSQNSLKDKRHLTTLTLLVSRTDKLSIRDDWKFVELEFN